MTPGEARWFELPVSRWSDHVAAANLQVRARSTRRELVLAAARRFATQGYHLTTLAQIVADGGRTKGALFFHFESKAALGRAVVDETLASWDDIAERIAARDLDPLRALLVVYDAQIARLMHDPVVQGGVRVLREDPGLQTDRHKWVEVWRAESEVLLERARAAGLLIEGADPAATSATLLSTIVGHHLLAEAQPDGPTVWERMSATWLGLLPTIAAGSWLGRWVTSGWTERPGPDGDAYARARRPAG
ncbi:TetR/AcrR family transcriptional regulator [Actinomycetospora sp. NBRC 106375]|uniref:TetR/AcrR family transcriptional regulator n=1 Tax=Actinomycetospora sp. NBRC 106375 TaxID=3032207 RepID=UPI002554897E|nr:TetR/AcrR family transcriptional regulator [Actinomycetospora sp. NBRC 106375]